MIRIEALRFDLRFDLILKFCVLFEQSLNRGRLLTYLLQRHVT